jgi:ribonuclease VapC
VTTVVDASVVLAWLQDEPASDRAEPLLMEGVIGAANWSEVLQKSRQHGVDTELVARLLVSFGLGVADVTQPDAEQAALLWRKGSGLSLADRLCIALGLRRGLPVATTDRHWLGQHEAPELLLLR